MEPRIPWANPHRADRQDSQEPAFQLDIVSPDGSGQLFQRLGFRLIPRTASEDRQNPFRLAPLPIGAQIKGTKHNQQGGGERQPQDHPSHGGAEAILAR